MEKCQTCKQPLPKKKFKCGVWVQPQYGKPRPCSKLVRKDGDNCKFHRIIQRIKNER